MSRVLLADASPHAQRMGGQILREEGFHVQTAADGDEARQRIDSFDPLVIIADVQLPGKSGYDLCQEIKTARPGVAAVILTAAAMAVAPDPERVLKSGCDATISKPFEATALIELVRRLAADCEAQRARRRPKPVAVEMDRERVEAAVTLALEAALPGVIQEITDRVLIALKY